MEGTVSGHVSLRAGKGDIGTAFFEHDVIAYRETWAAANGRVRDGDRQVELQ